MRCLLRYSAYGSVEGGLTVLTRYLAKEFSTRGIRVNPVAPRTTRTRIADSAFERILLSDTLQYIPVEPERRVLLYQRSTFTRRRERCD